MKKADSWVAAKVSARLAASMRGRASPELAIGADGPSGPVMGHRQEGLEKVLVRIDRRLIEVLGRFRATPQVAQPMAFPPFLFL